MTADGADSSDRPLEERLRRLLEHLGIERAHVAARLPRDWRGLVTVYPKRVSSLTLLGPMGLDVETVRELGARVLVLNGDRGPVAERVQGSMAMLPAAQVAPLPDYAVLGWSDLAADRTAVIADAMLEFLDRTTAGGDPPPMQSTDCEGEIAGLSYRIRGAGPPLVLLPLWLSPSQWEPLLPRLSERYCTILLGGPAVGAVAILEARGQAPGFRRVLRMVLDEVGLEPGQTVLNVGSGTGVADRWIATVTRGANRIVGLDINRYFLREATALVQRAGLAATVSFHEGSADALPFPDHEFDVSLSITVIEEVKADGMLAEMVRVTRPGGRVAVVCRAMDLPSVMHLPLEPAVKRTAEAPGSIGHVEADGCADASLYARARRAGLRNLRMFPYLATFDASAPIVVEFLESVLLPRLGRDEAREWRAARARAEADGTFFVSWPHHCVVGTRA